MLCLSGTDGEILWEVDKGVPVYEPTLADGKVYVGDRCYSSEGEILWKGDIFAGGNGESTCFYDDKTYLVKDDIPTCFKASTGEIIWEHEKEEKEWLTSSMVAGFGKVFVTSRDKTYALDHLNGNIVWVSPFGTRWKKIPDKKINGVYNGGASAITDTKVVVSGGGGTACLDIDTGEILWESEVKGCLPVIVGDKHIWTAIGGTLSCLSLETGKTIIQKKYYTRGKNGLGYSQSSSCKR
ncbi:MAG: PQQ-binding-like beta-propeller repeat protein [Caldisericia bacterium]